MNDSTTAFAVPISEGNARAEDVSKHSAVSRDKIAEYGCEAIGRGGQVILFQSPNTLKQKTIVNRTVHGILEQHSRHHAVFLPGTDCFYLKHDIEPFQGQLDSISDL